MYVIDKILYFLVIVFPTFNLKPYSNFEFFLYIIQAFVYFFLSSEQYIKLAILFVTVYNFLYKLITLGLFNIFFSNCFFEIYIYKFIACFILEKKIKYFSAYLFILRNRNKLRMNLKN